MTLFAREVKGLTLTVTGATLLVLAQRMLALATELHSEAQRLRGKLQGQLRFGAFFDATLIRLGDLMRTMVARYPLLDIEVRHMNSRSVIAGVRAGTLDAGMALCAQPPEGLKALPLERLRYRIVAPASWREKVAGAEWKTVASWPWISTPADGSHYRMATRIFERYGFKPAKVIEADSEAMITSLVFAGVGLGLMREDLATQASEAGKVVMVPEGEAEVELTLLHALGREGDAIIEALVGAVRGLWQGDAPKEERSPSSGKRAE